MGSGQTAATGLVTVVGVVEATRRSSMWCTEMKGASPGLAASQPPPRTHGHFSSSIVSIHSNLVPVVSSRRETRAFSWMWPPMLIVGLLSSSVGVFDNGQGRFGSRFEAVHTKMD